MVSVLVRGLDGSVIFGPEEFALPVSVATLRDCVARTRPLLATTVAAFGEGAEAPHPFFPSLKSFASSCREELQRNDITVFRSPGLLKVQLLRAGAMLDDSVSLDEPGMELVAVLSVEELSPTCRAKYLQDFQRGHMHLMSLPEVAQADREVVMGYLIRRCTDANSFLPYTRDAVKTLSNLHTSLMIDRDFILGCLKLIRSILVPLNSFYFQQSMADLLLHVFSEFRTDKDIVMSAVSTAGLTLQYSSVSLLADKDVVLAAVTQYGQSLRYAAPILRSDKEIAILAVSHNCSRALRCVGSSLQADRDVVLAAFGKRTHKCRSGGVLCADCKKGLLRFASPALRADKDIAVAAIRASGLNLKHASATLGLREDKEFLLPTMRSSGRLLRLASVSLRGDKDVVLAAVSQHGSSLKYASAELQANKEVVLAAVHNFGFAVQYASFDLPIDPDILHAAKRARTV